MKRTIRFALLMCAFTCASFTKSIGAEMYPSAIVVKVLPSARNIINAIPGKSLVLELDTRTPAFKWEPDPGYDTSVVSVDLIAYRPGVTAGAPVPGVPMGSYLIVLRFNAPGKTVLNLVARRMSDHQAMASATVEISVTENGVPTPTLPMIPH